MRRFLFSDEAVFPKRCVRLAAGTPIRFPATEFKIHSSRVDQRTGTNHGGNSMTHTLPTTVLDTISFRGGRWSHALPTEFDSVQTAVFVFGAPQDSACAAARSDVMSAFPRSHIIGCSTAGEIHGDRLHDESISVAVMRFARTTLRSASSVLAGPDHSVEAGASLADKLAAPNLSGVFVLSSGLNVNGSGVVQGLTDGLAARGASQVVVTGGLAGDGADFGETWVMHGQATGTSLVAAIGFYGDAIRIGHGSRGGWDAFGPIRTVTRASENVLFELDGKPALDVYKRYLGDRADDLPSSGLLFPLLVTPNDGQEEPRVRTLLGIDEAAQSMTFAGEITPGATAQLMRANFDRIVIAASDSARDAFDMAGHDAPHLPTLSIAISCVGRRLILGERTEEETEATAESLGPFDRQVGFYSYGELSPITSGSCRLLNQTMTITTLREV